MAASEYRHSHRHDAAVPFQTTTNNSANQWLPGRNADLLPLLLYGILGGLGTTFNIFQISSLIIQEGLRRRGNVFLANQALANLLVTSISFPAMCVAILAGTQNDKFVCYWQWYSALLCFTVSVLNFFFISVENYFRVCCSQNYVYKVFCGAKMLVVIIFAMWIASASTVSLIVILKRGPNLCLRTFRDREVLLYAGVPAFFTALIFLCTVRDHRDNVNSQLGPVAAKGREVTLQRHLLRSNIISFALFVAFWLPLCVVVGAVPIPSLKALPYATLDNLFWLGQLYSCLNSLIYACSHDLFRQGFNYLVHYFCCRTHPDYPVSCHEKPRGCVRVHIGMETRLGGDKGARMNKFMSSMGSGDGSRGRTQEHYL